MTCWDFVLVSRILVVRYKWR